MASKNKKQDKTKSDAERRKKIADYVFAFLAILLILSMLFSAFAKY